MFIRHNVAAVVMILYVRCSTESYRRLLLDLVMAMSKLSEVLTFFDKHIVGEGVERLRLILYPLIPWAQLQCLKAPSDIYYELVHTFEECPHEEVLPIFVFSIKAIGGSVRGKLCSEKANELKPHFKISSIELSKQDRRFRFFFWLLKIERRLPTKCKEDLLRNLSRSSLDMNYRHFKGSVPRLFIKLNQKGKLNENDFGALLAALEILKKGTEDGGPILEDLEKCIAYLDKFHHGKEEDPFTSGM